MAHDTATPQDGDDAQDDAPREITMSGGLRLAPLERKAAG